MLASFPTNSIALGEVQYRLLGVQEEHFFCLADEICVKHILQDHHDNYVKGDLFGRVFGDIFGRNTSTLTTDGKEAKAHRKLISNGFARDQLRQSLAVMKSKLLQVAQLFDSHLDQQQALGGSFIDVDLDDIFSRIMLDVGLQFASGVEMNSLNNDHPFALAFDEVQLLTNQRLIDPIFELKRLFGLGQREKRIKEKNVVIKIFCNDVILKRRKMASTSVLKKDVLGFYLKLYENLEDELSNTKLRDMLLTMLIAARDTTRSALSWAFFEFTRHPKVVQKVIAEVEEICGLEQNADFSFDTLNKLEYTRAVAMEVLRLHPPVPMEVRIAAVNDTLPDGTFIPALSSVFYSAFAMGKSKKIWGDDAEEFNPERFYKKPEPSAFKFTVFHAGPGMCLGKSLALMNMKMVFAFLLPKYKFYDAARHSGDYIYSVSLAMKDGFPVQVSKKIQ